MVVVNVREYDNKTHSNIRKVQCDVKDNMEKNFKCYSCNKTYVSVFNLKYHIEANLNDEKHRQQIYQCALCGNYELFTLASDLRIHFLKFHKDKCVFCVTCGKFFVEKEALKAHISSIHERNHKCDTCGKSFSQAGYLKFHIKTIHEGQKDYECGYCGKTFSESKRLDKHIHTVHKGQKDYKCEPCGKSFSTKNALKYHVGGAIHEKIKDQKCIICGKIFFRKGYLKIHSLSHDEHKDLKKDSSSTIISRQGCDLCEKSFLNLKKHIRLFHETPKEYLCDACKKSFTSSRHFRRHNSTIHKSDPLRSHKCDSCKTSFSKEEHLSNHMDLVHDGKKIFICETCDKIFPSSMYLRRHNRRHQMKHHCQACGRSFFQEIDLQNHIHSVHEGEEHNKYECYLCSKLFSREIILENHISVVHDGNADHKCENCSKTFSSVQNLRKHISKKQCKVTVDEGQKSIKCKSCGKSFTSIYYLKDHIHTIHDEYKENKCDICDKDFPSLVRFRKHNLIFHRNSEIIETADEKSNYLANGIKMEEITEHGILESEINSILNNLTEENIEDIKTKDSRINSQPVEIIMVHEGGKSYFQNILKAPNTVTLSDIKNDEKYRYYVKTLEEGLECFEFCDDDFKILPMIENKIILKCYS